MNAAEFHYYPVAFKSDRCVWSCNALNNLSNEVCVPNKTKDLNLTVFDMSAEVNDWKILTKHVSCKCKCKFDERKRKINAGTMINVDVSVKSVMYVKKTIFGILPHAILKMENLWQVWWIIRDLRVMKL